MLRECPCPLGCVSVELYRNEILIDNLSIYPKSGYIEIARNQEGGFKQCALLKVALNDLIKVNKEHS